MSNGFNLNSHSLQSELPDSNMCPQGLMVWEPFLQKGNKQVQRLKEVVNIIHVQAVDLGDSLSACILDGQIDIGERLINLGSKVGMNLLGLGVPAAYMY